MTKRVAGGAILTTILACVLASAPAHAATATVTAADAALRACHSALTTNAATDAVRYTAKATGLVRARLTGRGGDWDVGVFDAKTKRSVAGSAAFGSNELAEGFVRKGQRLIVQACRERGS